MLVYPVEGGFVRYTEAYQAGVAQSHRIDAAEVIGLAIEVRLCAGNGGRRDHIYKAIGMLIDLTDARFGGLGGDQKDEFQSVTVGDRLVFRQVIGHGQIGDDHAIDSYPTAFAAEMLETKLHNGIQITHHHQRDVDVGTHGGELLEELAQGHAVLQGMVTRLLDDQAIGQWIGKGNADLHQIDRLRLQGFEHWKGIGQLRETCGEIDRQDIVFFRLK